MRSKTLRSLALKTALILTTLAVLSCGPRLPKSLPLDQNPVFTAGIGWLVVTQAYARVKAEPEGSAADVGHLRGGDVLAVQGRERDPKTGVAWYRINLGGAVGWLTKDQAAFFESRDAAERAAGRYK